MNGASSYVPPALHDAGHGGNHLLGADQWRGLQPHVCNRRRRRAGGVGFRRGWDSHHCWVLKTKNLQDCGFLTIRQIRTKALVETRIEHADVGACRSQVFKQLRARPLAETRAAAMGSFDRASYRDQTDGCPRPEIHAVRARLWPLSRHGLGERRRCRSASAHRGTQATRTDGRRRAHDRDRVFLLRRALWFQPPAQCVSLLDLTRQPCSRDLPVAHHRLRRDRERLSGFLHAQSSEEPELDDLRPSRVERRQRGEGIV